MFDSCLGRLKWKTMDDVAFWWLQRPRHSPIGRIQMKWEVSLCAQRMGLARTHLEKSVQEGFLPSWTSAKRSWSIHQMQKLRSIHHGVASKGAGWKLEGCRKLFLWGSCIRTTAERESALGICHTQWGPLPDYIQNYLETFLETRFTSSQPHSNPRGSQGV